MGIRRALGGVALTSSLLLVLSGCGGDLLDDYDTASETVEATPSEPAEPAEPASPSAAARDSPAPKARAERRKKPVRKAAPAQPPDITVPDLTMPPVFDRPVLGGDISWPQCPPGMGIPEKRTLGMPMPLPEAEYVIIGLTNGPGFTPNPCLADQVDWVRKRKLMAAGYAVSSYPTPEQLQEYGARGPFDAGTDVGRLRNVGYQHAHFTVGQMKAARLLTPIVWLDVEPVPSFEWSADKGANAAVVQGVARGYTDNGYEIGVYSTPALYDGVVGDLSLGGIPEWRAAGQTSQTEALSRCGSDWSIQGGDGVMGQWVQYSRDLNITCPGVERQMFRYFHQY